MNKQFQAKDIPDQPIIDFLAKIGRPGCMFEGAENSMANAVPDFAKDKPKLVRAKMQSMIKRGIVDGCTCGCRGDFTLTQ